MLTNPLWLFPHEGDTRYTYERSEIVVENGTLAYHGADIPEFAEQNNLNQVGCQPGDEGSARACAFDHHFVNHPPVTVPKKLLESRDAEFVRIDSAYYRRVHRVNGSGGNRTVTHNVERVTPQTVLREAALNISGRSGTVRDDLPLEYRVAVSGDTVTTFEDLDEPQLGNIYRQNESYYTVVGTGEKHIDHGFGFLRYEIPRYILMSVGFFLSVGTLVLDRTGDRG